MNLDFIKGVAKSTSEIEKDFIYYCFKGEKVDGHNFIEEAFSKGAKYVVGTDDYKFENYYKVEDIVKSFNEVSLSVYGIPKNINMIGITGTDGKTSTALIINQILDKFSTSSYLGTSGLIINGEKKEYSGMTTPFANVLLRDLKEVEKLKSKNFVMEISSHALEQKRVDVLSLDYAIFTNLTEEHLDFHNSMDEYFNAKIKISNLLKPSGKFIVNIDDKFGEKIKGENIITFGKNESADYVISNVIESVEGTKFKLTHKNNTIDISTNLLVEFNVYNLTAALITVEDMGYEINNVSKYLTNLIVEGRMELYRSDEFANVILDFAHTPDSVGKITTFVNKIKGDGEMYVVCGSAGERDSTKRPLMGTNCSMYAKEVILTEDDPRSESVKNINKDLKKGINTESCIVTEIENRYDAIEYVLKKANKNDIIVMLGKAGQDKMYYDGETVEYIEKNVVLNIIGKEKNE